MAKANNLRWGVGQFARCVLCLGWIDGKEAGWGLHLSPAGKRVAVKDNVPAKEDLSRGLVERDAARRVSRRVDHVQPAQGRHDVSIFQCLVYL